MFLLPKHIFRRSPKRALAAVRHIPRVLASVSAVRQFKHPFLVLRCYLGRRCTPNLYMETRSGHRIHLTGDPDDLVTVLVVMGRKDYGEIPKAGVVIDVGAHLGAFSLYALANGASRIYSFEPDPTLYATLVRNLRENGFTSQACVRQAAVTGDAAAHVTFFPSGNASGHVGSAADAGEGIQVSAVTLLDVVLGNGIETVDLLKLDCEGSEYGIIFTTPAEVWRRIARVRVEYHEGRQQELKDRFRAFGFSLVKAEHNTAVSGLLWFDRADSSRQPAAAGD